MAPIREAQHGKCTLEAAPGIADARDEVVSPQSGALITDSNTTGAINRRSVFCLVTIQYEILGDVPAVGQVWGEVFAGYRFDGYDPTRWCHELLHSGKPWPNLRIFKPAGRADDSWLCGKPGSWGCLNNSNAMLGTSGSLSNATDHVHCTFAFESEPWDSAYTWLADVDLEEERRSATPPYPGFAGPDVPAVVYGSCLETLGPGERLDCLVAADGLVRFGRQQPLLEQLRMQREHQASQTSLMWPLLVLCWTLACRCCCGAVRDAVTVLRDKPDGPRPSETEEERSPLACRQEAGTSSSSASKRFHEGLVSEESSQKLLKP